MKFKLFLLGTLVIAFLLESCGSAGTQVPKTALEVFEKGVELYKDEDYIEARKLFDVIKLQYPASQYADDAQFYLAEINYQMEEYILAAFNYSRLRSIYPSSEYVKLSLHKAAISYYNLSPTFDRDQEYTHKAIDAFNLFQRLYPDDSLARGSDKYISELRNKLAEREFSTALLYTKLYSPHSALVYYDAVIDDYPDSEFFEPAFYGKIEVLIELRRLDEAEGLIDIYGKRFPGSEFEEKARSAKKQIDGIKSGISTEDL